MILPERYGKSAFPDKPLQRFTRHPARLIVPLSRTTRLRTESRAVIKVAQDQIPSGTQHSPEFTQSTPRVRQQGKDTFAKETIHRPAGAGKNASARPSASARSGFRRRASSSKIREQSSPIAAKPWCVRRCSTVAAAPQPTSSNRAPGRKPQKAVARSVRNIPPGRSAGPVTSRNGPDS